MDTTGAGLGVKGTCSPTTTRVRSKRRASIQWLHATAVGAAEGCLTHPYHHDLSSYKRTTACPPYRNRIDPIHRTTPSTACRRIVLAVQRSHPSDPPALRQMRLRSSDRPRSSQSTEVTATKTRSPPSRTQ